MLLKGSKCSCQKGAKSCCGTYCKKHSGKAQRKIIEQLMKEPSHANVRYLVSQKWWTQWCDYANYLDVSVDTHLKQPSEGSSEVTQLYEKPPKI
jgi:hypothetical protein